MLYPNPRNGKLIIETSSRFLNGSALLSNAAGDPLISEDIYTHAFEMEMAHLPAGVYQLKITALNGKTTYDKVIKIE